MTYDEDAPTRTCPWPEVCTCTHVGCVDGWVERQRADGSEYVSPCPNCRPEVHRHFRDQSKSLRRLRRELPTLPRPSRFRRRSSQESG